MIDVATAASTHDIYGYFKDFLQPLATIFAAIVAVCVTFYFSRMQARTAQRQVDIAHDRLRFDLFEKRYKIYQDAQELIREIVTEREQVGIPTENMNNAIIRARNLDEAKFFFPNDICAIFDSISEDIQTVITETRARTNGDYAGSAAEKRLRDRLNNMPKDFFTVMSFPQLI
ncbi:MAG: hypothetical protein NUV50_05710 [Rhodospirillales bacterium]|nr:hypothetical protein [Rhodospirillales bacterium]